MSINIMPLEMQSSDLRWIAQTVHNAYHPIEKNKYWFDCPKEICDFILKKLEKHFESMYVKYGPISKSESGKRLYIDQNIRRWSKENV